MNLSFVAALLRLATMAIETRTGGIKPACARLLLGGTAPQFLFLLPRLLGLGEQVAGAQIAFQNVRTGDGDGTQPVEQALPVEAQLLLHLRIQQPRIGLHTQLSGLRVMRGSDCGLRCSVAAQSLCALVNPAREAAWISGRRHAGPPPPRPPAHAHAGPGAETR